MYKYVIMGANSDVGKTLVSELSSNESVLAVSRSVIEKNNSDKLTYLTGIDLLREKDLEIFVNQLNDKITSDTTIIHSVGDFWYHKPVDATTIVEAENMILSHYVTFYNVISKTLPLFKKIGGGKYIGFSCTSVYQNYPEMAAFTSAKSAIESLIKCTANENSQYGIIANGIALSTIGTDKVKKSKPEEYHPGYVTVDELISVITKVINLPNIVNGNIIKLLKYSPSYYNEAFFRRNPSGYS